MTEQRDRTARLRVIVYTAVVVLAGVGGMVAYGLLVGKPVYRWPTVDAALMGLTTIVLALIVHAVTSRLLPPNGNGNLSV